MFRILKATAGLLIYRKMTENFKIKQTFELSDQMKRRVFAIWNNEYPEKLIFNELSELDNYLQSLTNLSQFLLVNSKDSVVGWAIKFDRENERWFVIILSEEVKGKGLGRQMLEELKKGEQVLNGWVIDHNNDRKKNGEMYVSPIKFYEKCDFEILAATRLELEKISAVKIRWTSLNQ